MEMRLQKYLAHAGVASRRASEELIKQGRVTINGQIVSEMGIMVCDKDEIAVDGSPVILPITDDKLYIALNKPVGYVSTASDQFGRPTVLDLVKEIKERLYPVGRLDYDTSGLIILTNDGDFTYRLTHPSHEIDKVYEAEVSGIPTPDEIKHFEKGIWIENYLTSPAKLSIVRVEEGNAVIHVTIHEGKNRQVRKMCKAIGHQVLKLKRISIGPIALTNLSEGKWRRLTNKEVESLYQ